MTELEKLIWTDNDFDNMGWHDATLWAISVVSEDFRLLLDIDYIFEWVKPVPPSHYYNLFVSPCTLVFEGVQDIDVSFGFDNMLQPSILDINREALPHLPGSFLPDWKWHIELNEGNIRFRSTSFKQFVRKQPLHSTSSALSLVERGGISFAMGD
jgi:hypothetical protein